MKQNNYNARVAWTKYLKNIAMTYPSEYVLRIFKGVYPKLNFDKSKLRDKKILDISCGDGRNLSVLKECGFKVYATEITPEIIEKVKANLTKRKLKKITLKEGSNDKLPFNDSFFDFLLSWNACYYMGKNTDFQKHIKEYARLLKPDGYLVLSIPKKTCFIYQGSKEFKKGYILVQNDPFNLRNGEILRIFHSEKEIKKEFSQYFNRFIFASVHDDCFGLNYHWHLVICQKK